MTLADAPAWLYTGHTVHERHAPFIHRFRYRIASVLVDLDRLEEANRISRLFSVERFNLFSFFSRDHGLRDGSDLKAWARARFDEAGVDAGDGPIWLLCAPRVLGYVFNPLSVYFAEDAAGRLRGVIYQVHNTFGDAHAYVAPASGERRELQDAEKAFYVSPFFDVAGRYEFTLRPPGETFRLSILKQRESGPDLLATMAMKRRAMTTRNLVSLFASQPFSTVKTISAIHFEAFKLWIKGAKYHPRPEPPTAASRARLVETRSPRFGDRRD